MSTACFLFPHPDDEFAVTSLGVAHIVVLGHSN